MVLNKYLAHAGVCSRRKAVEFIQDGAVTVNGRIIKEPSFQVTPGDKVELQGQSIKLESKVYILLNKPKGYITTVSDERDRKTVMELVEHATNARIYPVGRLDRTTTGLLLLTNDGELMQLLAHPKHQVQKTYHVTLERNIETKDLERISRGILLPDGKVRVDSVRSMPGKPLNEVEVVLHSGKYRVVRRIFEYCGYDVKKLDRVIYAGLTKKGVPVGSWRYLKDKEIEALKKS